MKKLLLIALLYLVTFAFVSCGSDKKDEPPTEIPVTASEIRGEWGKTYANNFYYLTFHENNELSLFVMEIDTKKILFKQFSDFRIEGTILHLSEEGFIMSGSKIYWIDDTKTRLFVGPIQELTRIK